MNTDIEEQEPFLECEKSWVFLVLMGVAGFYGAFTYTIRGGIFCNAQTANFVLLAMAIGDFDWKRAIYFIIPMTAYFLGAVVSEVVPKPIKNSLFMRWDTLLILIEMLVVVVLGFLPESAPHQISQVAINFICSMQYNTFRQAEGIRMATTFCTNHLRQIGIASVKLKKNQGDDALSYKRRGHIEMLASFVLGGVIATILCRLFLGKAIWFTLIPLGILFVSLFYADRKKENEMLNQVPRGH